MPWNGEETCSMPYNENLSSQVVDYKCAKCGKLGHNSSSCMGKKKIFGEVLATNYDEIYHRNEPTLGCELSSPITCQCCGVNGHDRNSCTRKFFLVNCLSPLKTISILNDWTILLKVMLKNHNLYN